METRDQSKRIGPIAILADGPSACPLRHIDARDLEGVYVIAVNGAIEWAPRADALFSLDPDRRIYELASRRRPGVDYFMAVPDDYGRRGAACRDHRVRRLRHVIYLRRLAGDGPLSSRPGLTDDPTAIHTGNSAFGALGLAKHLCDGAGRVALFGVDGTRRRISGGHCQSLGHLPWLFSTVSEPGMEIVNGSIGSFVTAFPRMGALDALAWLKS